MTPQSPAQGIMLANEFNDARVYTVACQCGSTGHMVNMWIETTSENDTQEVTLTFYVKTQTPWWSLNRFKQIWEILTKGHIEYEADLILNKQSAVNLANTITKSVKDLSTKS